MRVTILYTVIRFLQNEKSRTAWRPRAHTPPPEFLLLPLPWSPLKALYLRVSLRMLQFALTEDAACSQAGHARAREHAHAHARS